MSGQSSSYQAGLIRSHIRRRTVIAATFASAILVAGIAVSVLNAGSPDYDEIRSVVTNALQDSQSLPAPAAAERAAARGVTSDQWLGEASGRFATEYTGDVLARKVTLVTRANRGGNDGILAGDAGVKNIVFEKLNVSGSTATAVVTATAWATITEAQPGQSPETSNPTGVVDWSFSLVKTTAGWRINGEDVTFEPGSEP